MQLNSRIQKPRANDVKSHKSPHYSSVLQGSVKGILKFMIYIYNRDSDINNDNSKLRNATSTVDWIIISIHDAKVQKSLKLIELSKKRQTLFTTRILKEKRQKTLKYFHLKSIKFHNKPSICGSYSIELRSRTECIMSKIELGVY